jgi:hypothetical protein
VIFLGDFSFVRIFLKNYRVTMTTTLDDTSCSENTMVLSARRGFLLHVFSSIYTDSLPSTTKSCNLQSFVDDSKTFLTFPVSSINCSLEAIEEDLQRIFQWCCNHSLLINPGKTQNVDSWITTNDATDTDST